MKKTYTPPRLHTCTLSHRTTLLAGSGYGEESAKPMSDSGESFSVTDIRENGDAGAAI